MNIEYIRNLTGSYMIIKNADYPYENSELLMMLNNKIPGLLELQIIISNGKLEYWYDITGTTSLGTMMELFSLDGHKFRRMIEDIYDMNCQLEDFMLDGENVSYLPEMIYYDRESEKYKFCYIPGIKTIGRNTIQTLSEYLLTKIDHKDQKAVKMGYDFYEKSIQESCSAKELLSCVVLPEPDMMETVPRETQDVSEDSCTPQITLEDDWPITDDDMPFGLRKGLLGKRSVKIKKKRAFSKTKDYSDVLQEKSFVQKVAEPLMRATPTVFIKPEPESEVARLLYQGEGNEDNFVLNEDTFIVGKDTEKANGHMKADTVSRLHAKIIRKDNAYYIEDLNSTNGTYVNGKELYYREPIKLEKMDRIHFATEEYLFG